MHSIELLWSEKSFSVIVIRLKRCCTMRWREANACKHVYVVLCVQHDTIDGSPKKLQCSANNFQIPTLIHIKALCALGCFRSCMRRTLMHYAVYVLKAAELSWVELSCFQMEKTLNLNKKVSQRASLMKSFQLITQNVIIIQSKYETKTQSSFLSFCYFFRSVVSNA